MKLSIEWKAGFNSLILKNIYIEKKALKFINYIIK